MPEIISLDRGHSIIVGDSTNKSNVDALLQGSTPSIIVFDPPYEIPDIYKEIQPPEFGLPQALIVFWDTLRANHAHVAAYDAGWKFKFELCWDNQGVCFRENDQPHWGHKSCGVFGHGWEWDNDRASLFMPVKKDRKHIKFSSLYRHQKSRMTGHKHAKPDEWIACILHGTGLNGIVFDPFVGGGSTVRACDLVGLECRGIEKNRSNIEEFLIK